MVMLVRSGMELAREHLAVPLFPLWPGQVQNIHGLHVQWAYQPEGRRIAVKRIQEYKLNGAISAEV